MVKSSENTDGYWDREGGGGAYISVVRDRYVKYNCYYTIYGIVNSIRHVLSTANLSVNEPGSFVLQFKHNQ